VYTKPCKNTLLVLKIKDINKSIFKMHIFSTKFFGCCNLQHAARRSKSRKKKGKKMERKQKKGHLLRKPIHKSISVDREREKEKEF
jgi:hypothetical protein